ncbi:MAG: BlaI/MecI/CopY family transcriptional regulator [Planctomycetaceae bacterium]|nr:BlaI/MecI/CopY family transcriptional regulator [Planctomycetaceae bacterium]
MARPPSRQFTEVELQVLNVLWEQGPSPVRDIHTRLNQERGTNYSTTVKMLSVMLEKGLLTRDESQTPHIYKAAVTRNRAGRRMLDNLVRRIYEGSTMSLVVQALTHGNASPEEIGELRQLLDELEKKPS